MGRYTALTRHEYRRTWNPAKWGHVDYYKESGVNENITAFHKPDIFEHQNEFRILIKENSTTPLSFEIGSIEDISIMFDTNDLKKITLKKQ